jgi:hypothetical protein
MTEAQLQAAVTDLCKLYGIWWYHTHDSRKSVPGWPDLALCGPKGLIFRELKSQRGRLRPEQQAWGDRIRQCGQDWNVWRPDDLHSGRIIRELQAIR